MPGWLLGCRLAEEDFSPAKPSAPGVAIWTGRVLVWSAAWGCSALRFHSPAGYPWTLNLFAIAVFFWLRAEILSFRGQKPPAVLEWAGKWSYSIYLTHLIAFSLFVKIWPGYDKVNKLEWTGMFVFVVLFAYVFYLLVEKPGHYIAKRAAAIVNRGNAGGSGSPDENAAPARPVPSETVK
jgi:peptidoglycan/LPS O-acetylase OafA/YrhL